MARIRTIKPEMAQDEDLASISSWAQLLADRVLCHCDDEGYFKANPKLVQSMCFPLIDDDSLSVHGAISELAMIGYIKLYIGDDGKKYGKVSNFLKHQKINRPQASKIAALQLFTDDSLNTHESITVGKERKGKERKGKDTMSGKPDDDAKNIIDYLNERTGKSFEHVDSNLNLVKARLNEGHDIEKIKTVISMQVDNWQGTKMETYLRPATLFNATKFNQYVGEIDTWLRESANIVNWENEL